MSQPKHPKNTTHRDHNYGDLGNGAYEHVKQEVEVNFKKYTPDELAKILVPQFAVPSYLNQLPKADKLRFTQMNNAGIEAVEDVYLEHHLPSPFPHKAAQKPTTPGKN